MPLSGGLWWHLLWNGIGHDGGQWSLDIRIKKAGRDYIMSLCSSGCVMSGTFLPVFFCQVGIPALVHIKQRGPSGKFSRVSSLLSEFKLVTASYDQVPFKLQVLLATAVTTTPTPPHQAMYCVSRCRPAYSSCFGCSYCCCHGASDLCAFLLGDSALLGTTLVDREFFIGNASHAKSISDGHVHLGA